MPYTKVRIIDYLSTVKGIEEARYSIVEYIRVPLLLPRKSNISEPMLVEITINIHLVNNL